MQKVSAFTLVTCLLFSLKLAGLAPSLNWFWVFAPVILEVVLWLLFAFWFVFNPFGEFTKYVFVKLQILKQKRDERRSLRQFSKLAKHARKN